MLRKSLDKHIVSLYFAKKIENSRSDLQGMDRAWSQTKINRNDKFNQHLHWKVFLRTSLENWASIFIWRVFQAENIVAISSSSVFSAELNMLSHMPSLPHSDECLSKLQLHNIKQKMQS